MPSYVPNTDQDRQAMLATLGVSSVDDLFGDIPPDIGNASLDLPPGLTELELQREMVHLAKKNLALDQMPSFLGAGAYRHFIPSVVDHILRRGEFYTAYTPYQPEISQGTLQAIFEFQSMMCQITGMEVANSGMYDGASALAEAALMACRVTGRSKIASLSTVNRSWREVVSTYCEGQAIAHETIAPEQLRLDESYACLLVQYPNFFGCLEDLRAWVQAAHQAGALLVVATGLMPLGLLRPPGSLGADIVVAEGQPLGQSLSFGGPYVGVFCCREQYLRQMPGRIVGRTTDARGRTGYVLTLQAREQHIRRERATSNICTSQALVGLAVTVYVASLGPQGLREVAEQCYHKAHYLADQIAALPGYSLPLGGAFFNEFVVRCPVPPGEVNRRLLQEGILGGLDVSDQVEGGLLLCCTELNTREEMDRLVRALHAYALQQPMRSSRDGATDGGAA
ncbi:MAG: aminomethyl-transferring glycine dehydrogenase subunit GcvPA [Chloroflexi bacterium]|nr:aminomethyl-transferring glycine dehydrogenase subunit GcvPA [Chloroflexota bacterium]